MTDCIKERRRGGGGGDDDEQFLFLSYSMASTFVRIYVYTYSRCEVVTRKRRREWAKSLKREVLACARTALLKQNASFNCNGRL